MSYCPHQRLSNSCHSLIMVLSQMCYFRNDNMFSSFPADLRMSPTCISNLTHQADMPFHRAQSKTGSLGSPPKHVPLSRHLVLHVLPLTTRSMSLPSQQGDTPSVYHKRKAAMLGLSLQKLTCRSTNLRCVSHHA